jgi:non-ribosomal peptide synthetase component F
VPLHALDLSASAPADAEAEAERILDADAQRPFDLEVGPLLRAHLVRLSATRCELGLTLHHIVSDGWSVGVVLAELLKAYEAFAKGQEPDDLPLLPFQYGDYAEWEERWLGGEAAKQQLEYWSQRLAGPLPVVDLPADLERPKVQTFRGGKHGSRLSADLSLRIAELSRKHAATPFMTILAAFALVMNRQTGLDDLPIGVPFAGRNREGTDRLVGVFINTVVVRFDFQGDPTFEEHLLRTRSLALEAYRNADVPFDRVVDVLRPRRDPGRTPLFQVLVNSVSFGKRSRFELPGLAVELRGDAMAASCAASPSTSARTGSAKPSAVPAGRSPPAR